MRSFLRATPSRRDVLIGMTGIALVGAVGVDGAFPAAAEAAVFGPGTLFTPPSSAPAPKVLYPRAVQLKSSGSANGTMLATFEQYTNDTPSFPIFRSTNGGSSWTQYSTVIDTANGWGLRYQPFLYELPTAVGNYPAGTVLCIGNSIPSDLSRTKLDVYASRDSGKTWTYVSSIANGGAANASNGQTPVWEPFALVNNGRLSVFYSDQRDPAYGQKLVHQTTTTLTSWGSVVNDIISPRYNDRPGMATIAALPGAQWIMTYEYPGAPGGGYPVYYRISNDPENWVNAPERVLRTTEGEIPASSPYVVWAPGGGPQGTIIVSANNDSALFLNTMNGAQDSWVKVPAPAGGGYSRCLIPLSDSKTVFMVDAGVIGGSSNAVTFGAVELAGAITSGSTYKVLNRNSGLVLGVQNASTAAGAGLLQWNDNGTGDHLWRFERQTSGYWRIRNGNSGLVAGITNQAPDNGTLAVQWTDNGTPDHDWVIVPYPTAGYVFANRATGKRLEIGNASTAIGAAAQQWAYTANSCQAWTLT